MIKRKCNRLFLFILHYMFNYYRRGSISVAMGIIGYLWAKNYDPWIHIGLIILLRRKGLCIWTESDWYIIIFIPTSSTPWIIVFYHFSFYFWNMTVYLLYKNQLTMYAVHDLNFPLSPVIPWCQKCTLSSIWSVHLIIDTKAPIYS